jgi:hypothetical protein
MSSVRQPHWRPEPYFYKRRVAGDGDGEIGGHVVDPLRSFDVAGRNTTATSYERMMQCVKDGYLNYIVSSEDNSHPCASYRLTYVQQIVSGRSCVRLE